MRHAGGLLVAPTVGAAQELMVPAELEAVTTACLTRVEAILRVSTSFSASMSSELVVAVEAIPMIPASVSASSERVGFSTSIALGNGVGAGKVCLGTPICSASATFLSSKVSRLLEDAAGFGGVLGPGGLT